MKSTKSFIALAMLSASVVMGSSAFAQNTRADVQADLQAYNQSGLAELERGEATVDTNSAAYKAAEQRYETLRGDKANVQSVSRNDVQKDLSAYQASGLADMNTGNRNYDEFSVQYQNAVAKYNQLRSHS